MKVLFLEWKSFGNDYMIDTLQRKGYEVVCMPFPRETEDTRYSDHLATAIAQELLNNHYTYVFSFNYFPVAAIACKACKVSYIAWVYDSPFIQLYSETVKYDTNHIFLFDSAECERLNALGVSTVEYLPMAAAAEYYDKLIPDTQIHKEYDCDIAFIGSTYSEEKQHMFRHLKELDDYTKGYLDAAMQAQKQVYGYNFMEQVLSPQIVANMQKVCPVMEHGDGFETVEWVFATYFLDRKITAMERAEILQMLSGNYHVNLYTPEATPNLPSVHNKGKLDYYSEAPFAMKCAKINLNITLKSIVNGIPLRAMDIMACGGFLLTNYQADFFELFEPDKDFVFYENYSEEDCTKRLSKSKKTPLLPTKSGENVCIIRGVH
jgi:spore maturation protein CgeB